jgi:hypothetical protein
MIFWRPWTCQTPRYSKSIANAAVAVSVFSMWEVTMRGYAAFTDGGKRARTGCADPAVFKSAAGR